MIIHTGVCRTDLVCKMRPLVAVAFLCFFGGTRGYTADSGGRNDGLLTQLTQRMVHLEAKVEKLDAVEARVAELERIVINQQLTIQKQSRKLNILESLLKGFVADSPVSISRDESEGAAVVPQGPEVGVSERRQGPKGHPGDRKSRIVPESSGNRQSPKPVAINRGVRANGEGVAFSAELDHDTGHLGEHQIVAFNRVMFNDGNGYDSNTGTFTAPMPGVYLFIYNFGHSGVGQTWLQLKVNGNVKNVATAEGFHANQELQGVNTAIVQLTQGDKVWVEAYRSDHDNRVDGHHLLTTFTGAILYFL